MARHRTDSGASVPLEQIKPADREVTRRDAVLYAVGANAAHGLKRTNRDKRNAICKMLSDPLVSLNDDGIPWSDWVIARRCVVSNHTVAAERAARFPVTRQIPSDIRAYTTKHGTTSTMSVSNIGAGPTPAPAATAEPAADEWQHHGRARTAAGIRSLNFKENSSSRSLVSRIFGRSPTQTAMAGSSPPSR